MKSKGPNSSFVQAQVIQNTSMATASRLYSLSKVVYPNLETRTVRVEAVNPHYQHKRDSAKLRSSDTEFEGPQMLSTNFVSICWLPRSKIAAHHFIVSNERNLVNRRTIWKKQGSKERNLRTFFLRTVLTHRGWVHLPDGRSLSVKLRRLPGSTCIQREDSIIRIRYDVQLGFNSR
jgi:hypothetical protein